MKAVRIRAGARLRLSATSVVIAVIGSTLTWATPAFAGTCSEADLVPQLREVSINQGLGSYPKLVRGKDALVRAYLTLPACAADAPKTPSQSIGLSGARLQVIIGGAVVHEVGAPTNSLNPPPPLVPSSDYSTTGAGNHTSNPIWAVPGSALSPALTGGFQVQFKISLTYETKSGTTTVPNKTITFDRKPGTTLPISAEVWDKSKPERILAIPMGDPTAADQFSSSAATATTTGFSSLSRIFPVATGATNLAIPGTNGVRYTINQDALVNVAPYMTAANGGLFCGDASSFGDIESQLAGYLQAYNMNNISDLWADRASGMIDQQISKDGCAEGWASLDSPYSWSRALYPTAAGAVSRTGAILAMEVAHNYGLVPQSRSSTTHSSNTNADISPAVNRAFNVADRLWLGTVSDGTTRDDRSALRTDAGWDNFTSVLEKADWETLFCELGGPENTECTTTTTEDLWNMTSASEPVDALTGTFDGGSVSVLDSSSGLPGPATKAAANSDLKFVQRIGSSGQTRVRGVPLTGSESVHDEHFSGTRQMSGGQVFSFQFPVLPNASRIELWKGEPEETCVGNPRCLFFRDKNVKPAITSMSAKPWTATSGGDEPGATSKSHEGTALASASAEAEATVTTVAPEDFDPELRTLIDFEDRRPGDEVSQSYADKGVTFDSRLSPAADSDLTHTRTIVGSCDQSQPNPEDVPCRFPLDAGTASGVNSLWNQPVPASPLDPVPASSGVPLGIDFAKPVRKVGMYVGNNDSPDPLATATLTAFDGSGAEIGRSTVGPFGAAVDKFIGLDVGSEIIERVELSYGAAAFGEEIDDLMFSPHVAPEPEPTITASPTPTTTPSPTPTVAPEPYIYDIEVVMTDDVTAHDRVTLFSECEGQRRPLTVGLLPTSTTETTSTFNFRLDARRTCTDPATDKTTILARGGDGFETTVGYASVAVDSPDQSSVAVINSPSGAVQILEHEAIPVSGQGWHPRFGTFSGAEEWFVNGQKQAVVDGQIAAPAGGWNPQGVLSQALELTYRVSTPTGDVVSASRTITSRQDNDNDSLPAPEPPCGFSDDNPHDAASDGDKDAIPAYDDFDPCAGETAYDASIRIDPKELQLSASSTPVTAYVKAAYPRDLSKISAQDARIIAIQGEPLAEPLVATDWRVNGKGHDQEGVGKFDRQKIIERALALGVRDNTLYLTVQVVSGTSFKATGVGTTVTKST